VARELAVTAEWSGWDGEGHEVLSLGWETGGWTADGVVSGIDVHYVVRVDERWRLRQFLLFRDLPEPDLWLGVDPAGRWGEINGARRPELDRCADVDLPWTPFAATPAIRRLRIEVGDTAEVAVARVDPETLAVEPAVVVYTRLALDRWRRDGVELVVDEHGLPLDHPGRFHRLV